MDAQARLQRAEDQLRAQERKVEEARKQAQSLEDYLVQVGVQQAQGEKVEPTATAQQLNAAQTELRTATAVFAELKKLYEQAEQDVREREREVFVTEYNRMAGEREKINARIENTVRALRSELDALDALDRKQRAAGSRLGLQLNTRRFAPQENYISWQLRDYVTPAGVLPQSLRRGINEMDRQTRRAAAEPTAAAK